MTVADNRRARLLRGWMGQTGCVGEWIANPGGKKRVSYPSPREGVLGSAGKADVRIRHRDMARAHAHFELREGGLVIKPMGRAQLSVGGGPTGDAVFLRDGEVLDIGKLRLMLVLFDAPVEREEAADDWFEVAPEAADLAASNAWHDGGRPADPSHSDEWFDPAADSDNWLDAKPARARGAPGRTGGVPVTGQFGPAPARGRRADARAGKRSGAAGKKRRAAPDDTFNEDEIWLDR